jgi:hypothetical protein
MKFDIEDVKETVLTTDNAVYDDKTVFSTHVVQPVIPDEVPLERNFSFLSSLGLAFTLLNSWTGEWRQEDSTDMQQCKPLCSRNGLTYRSGSLSLVLPSGGSISMIWGLLTSAVGTMFMVLSLCV